jgi:hypothetical protein
VWDGMAMPPADFPAWLDEIRSTIAGSPAG